MAQGNRSQRFGHHERVKVVLVDSQVKEGYNKRMDWAVSLAHEGRETDGSQTCVHH